MILEERDLDFRIRPEVRPFIAAAFTQALDRHADEILIVRIRLIATKSWEHCCRARLFPMRGRSLAASSSADSPADAAQATARTLRRRLVRRLALPKFGTRVGGTEFHSRREADRIAFVGGPHGGRAHVDHDLGEELAEEFLWAVTGSDEPRAAYEAMHDPRA